MKYAEWIQRQELRGVHKDVVAEIAGVFDQDAEIEHAVFDKRTLTFWLLTKTMLIQGNVAVRFSHENNLSRVTAALKTYSLQHLVGVDWHGEYLSNGERSREDNHGVRFIVSFSGSSGLPSVVVPPSTGQELQDDVKADYRALGSALLKRLTAQ